VRESNAPAQLLPEASGIIDCFALAEPTAGNLSLCDARVATIPAAQSALKALQMKVTERARHLTNRHQFENQYQPLVASYPEARVHSIRADYELAERGKIDARNEAARIMPLFNKAKEQLQRLDSTVQGAKASQQEAEQNRRSSQRMAADAQAHMEQEICALSPTWQEAARQVDGERIAKWQSEIASLKGADERYEELRHARSQITLVEAQSLQIDLELEAIPLEARQPVETLQQEETEARSAQQNGEEEQQRAVSELQRLKDRCQRINKLLAEKRTAEKSEAHYKLLTTYLGRDYLQRFLLQQAELKIVGLANTVLDHCSGGTLRMSLCPNVEEGVHQKAFDLMVENHATQSTQEKMLPAWLLSGSQRFRVAISLALAIGQYASENGQRIESVIIDEGFGSLDRQGLRDMEDALRALGGIIKRIILVSHQDDFAKAFPHRYAVWLEDGASQARLVDDLEAV
jgi:DNA repair exonuclease SbcCD ATPase subunit